MGVINIFIDNLYYFLNNYSEIVIITWINVLKQVRSLIMSKKCCGITYTDDETVCKICGRSLVEDVQDEEYKRMLEETNKVVEDVLRMQKEGGDVPPDEAAGVTEEDDIETKGNEDVTDNNETIEDTEISGDSDVVDDEEITDNEAIDDLEEADAKEKISVDRAGGGTKAFGIISLIVAVLGLAFITLCVIFLIVFPIYDKSGMEGKKLEYPEIATSADAAQQRALLTPTDIELDTFFDDVTATATDAGKASEDTTETADTTEQAE